MARQNSARRFYLDTEDTLAEVGITRRQLNYWREKGLITPELGRDSKRYTERDIEQLKYLHNLIVYLGFPPELIKRMMPTPPSGGNLDISEFQYLYLPGLEPLTAGEIQRRLWNEFGATASEEEIEERLYALAFLLFRVTRTQYRAPHAFQGRRDEILGTIRELSYVARIEEEYSVEGLIEVGVRPVLPDEEACGKEWFQDLRRLFIKHYRRLEGFRSAWVGLLGKDRDLDSRRFFHDDVVEHIVLPDDSFARSVDA